MFVQSIQRAKELFQELIYDGMNVDVIHSERTQAQRDNIVKCFRSGKVRPTCFPFSNWKFMVCKQCDYTLQPMACTRNMFPVTEYSCLFIQIWILICTDVMGRGIDFKGVNLVLNYDFPTSAVSYIHRIGKGYPRI